MVAEFRAWGARKHSPPSERGVPPGERWAIGLCLQSEWKGRRGEYCGVPSMIAFAWSIRNGVDGLVAVAEPRLPRRPCAVLPPSRPPAASLFPCVDIPFMAAPPPSRRGAGPVAPLAPCIRGNSMGGSTKFPEEPNIWLSMRLAGTRRRRDSPPYQITCERMNFTPCQFVLGCSKLFEKSPHASGGEAEGAREGMGGKPEKSEGDYSEC